MDAIWFSLISEGQVMLFPKLRKDAAFFVGSHQKYKTLRGCFFCITVDR